MYAPELRIFTNSSPSREIEEKMRKKQNSLAFFELMSNLTKGEATFLLAHRWVGTIRASC